MLRRAALRMSSSLAQAPRRAGAIRMFSAGGSPLDISPNNAGHRYAFGDEAQVDDSKEWGGNEFIY